MGTMIVGAVVLAVCGLAVRKIYQDKKSGKSCSCGGSCMGCQGECHTK